LLPGSTMEINGHGLGDSFLSVVAGRGTYLEDNKGNDQTLELGSVLLIDKDTEIRLTNSADSDLLAFLLSTTPSEDASRQNSARHQPRASAHG